MNLEDLKNQVADSLEKQYEWLRSRGILRGFEVGNIDTLHNKKNWKGKLKDWVKWKTPLKRFFYKPYWEEVTLVSVLEYHWDNGAFEELNLSDKEFEMLLRGAEGIHVWEKRWPDNPYEIMEVEASFAPVIPIDYVRMTLTTEPLDAETRPTEKEK